MRTAIILDAWRIKRAIREGTPNNSITTDHLHECLGWEKIINYDEKMQIAKERQSHIDSIFSKQKAQKKRGISDLERLSRVSRESSDK